MINQEYKAIIDAMIKYETLQEAADFIGTTPATIRELMQNPEFKKAYIKAKMDAIRKHKGAIVETPEKFIH